MVLEWLNLILRWVHVIAAIAWIGHSFLFNELERALVPPDDKDDKNDGELWMVHGGGFFQLVKTKVFPERLVGPLHWFKWEAGFTWISGFCLLLVVYYHGGGMYLLPTGSTAGPGQAMGFGMLAIFGGFVVYDLLCRSPIGHNSLVFGIVGLGLMTLTAFALSKVLAGRAMYIHMGAMIGTIMAANVWMVIVPSMKRMLAGVKPGDRLDVMLGERAKQRSLHNNYLVFPLIFTMLSNHFPTTYGSDSSWLILSVMFALGAGIKHVMNVRSRSLGLWLALAAAIVGAAGLAIYKASQEDDGETVHVGPIVGESSAVVPIPGESSRVVGPTAPLPDVGELPTGSVGGLVLLKGTPPPPKRLVFTDGGCEMGHHGAVYDESIVVTDGRLANAFVFIASGLEDWSGEIPNGEVEVDQVGCVFLPRVVGMVAGQKLVFRNGDAILHNVQLETAANPGFTATLEMQGMKEGKRLRLPETMIGVKCDVHPWMRGWVGVCANPFFAVTGKDGRFVMPGVPPGTYEVEVWHEVYGRQRASVTLSEGGTAPLRFVFEVE